MARQERLDRDIVKSTLNAVVQVIALRQGFLGNLSTAWTGSGTIIDPRGFILTNCHVANPRAMGMPAPPADKLAIAITERSDEPPVVTYLVDIVAQSPKADLAILKVVGRLDKKGSSRMNLPYVPLGDSDALELGDMLSIFGFPGIGGDTVTFTSGSVSGFTRQKDLTSGRGWIKTDATIAGGNSGGTAVDREGKLIGIPTQAAAGTGISPVDARPVVDTNQDGRVDQRDTPMSVGGFINGLRPVNLALPLFKKAGVKTSTRRRTSSQTAKPSKPIKETSISSSVKPSKPKTTKKSSGKSKVRAKTPAISNLVFSESVTKDGRPINPSAILSGNRKQVFASFEYNAMKKGLNWGQVWAVDGKPILKDESTWEDGSQGRKTIAVASKNRLPEGEYHLVLTVERKIVSEGQVTVGRKADDKDTEISGQIIDRSNKRGIANALVIALKPNVPTKEFIRKQSKDMAFTSARTDRNGRFSFPKQLPKGNAYGLIVVARGYQDLAIEGALRISPQAPEKAQIYPVPMIKG